MEVSSEQKAVPSLIPGLDGLRACSVLAVLCFHASAEWLPGGFLGVEVFFVISGFLITGLLVKEQGAQGRIALGRFWTRRVRRLLPALLALLFSVSTVAVCFLGTQASPLRNDLLWSLCYVQNWHQIWSGDSYFADQGLPLLRHLWSLGVEGQFYLAWPFLVAGALRVFRGRIWPLAILTAMLGAGSLALMLRLADPENLSSVAALASLNRVYLGTDTRVLGLLVGALLALLLRPRPTGRTLAGALDAGSFLALGALGWLMVRTDFQAPLLYRGGLLLVDALTALVIATLAMPSTTWLKAILGWAPLDWIGQRSYGIYLWHFPVFKLLAPGRQDDLGWALRVLVTVVLTELCYRFLEVPIRQGALQRWVAQHARPGQGRRRPLSFRFAAILLVGVGVLGWESYALASRAPGVDPVAESIRRGAAALDNRGPVPLVPIALVPVPAAEPPGHRPAAVAKEEPALPMPETLKGVHITAIGDSVMKGAALSLKGMGEASIGSDMIQINAEECRSFTQAMQVVRAYREQQRLGEVVVVHLGANNSSISEVQLGKLMALLADRRLVLFLTAKSDKTKACKSVNQTLATLVPTFPNAQVLDWKTAADLHPDFFYSDQTHLRPAGARFYARLILNQVARAAEPAEPHRVQ